MPAKASKKSAKAGPGSSKSQGFTDDEKAAMKERARELKGEARAGKDKAAGDSAVRAKLAGMPQPDRTLGQRVHALVTATAPELTPKLWYGMPAYANQTGKVVCFFQAASKFKTRYATFGFMDTAKLDAGAGGMWPTGFGLKELTAPEEAKIVLLVKKAMD